MTVTDNERVIRAFTEEQVVRLTALSQRQLRYWDRTGFFRPAFSEENRRVAYNRVYSFKDVCALRMIAARRLFFDIGHGFIKTHR
jgi:DNA-binding transcriptional MerR regulator